MTKDINGLVNADPLLPLFSSHFLYSLPQHHRAVLSELQSLVLSLDVHLKLILVNKGQILVEEDIHTETHTPDISGLAWVSITACELMLWPSEAWSASWEVGDVVILSISDSCKIDNFDLISNIGSLTAKNIVYLNIPIGDSLVVHVLYALTHLQEDNPADISQVSSPIFAWNVLHDLRVSIVAQIEFVPVHDLSEVAQLVHHDDLITTVYDLWAACDILMIESL